MTEILANPAWHHGGGGGWWFLFPLAWFLLIGALLFFGLRRWKRPGPSRPPAEEALAERFARGDMTEDEFRERLAVLKTAWERSDR